MGGPRGDFYKVVLGPSHLKHSWVKSSELVDKNVNDEETHTCLVTIFCFQKEHIKNSDTFSTDLITNFSIDKATRKKVI